MEALQDLIRFDGQHVVVTGGAHGIGASISELFVKQGASVTICDIEIEAAQCTAERIGARALQFDQGQTASVKNLASELGHVDVLVNNAGVLLIKPIVDCDASDIESLFQIDVVGVCLLSALVGRSMIANGKGVIVNMASQTALSGGEGRAIYAAAKAAIIQFTKSASVEWGPKGVRVVCVAPGRCHTRMTAQTIKSDNGIDRGLERVPLRRYGQPEDPARAVVFLASEAASYITGETVLVDGGYVIG